jgi:acyl-coenzyme A synthetase/AMP-(fatty) acid ligase
VSPVEVEAALDSLENINESAVFSIEAEKNKMLIYAVVVLDDNSQFIEKDIKMALTKTLAKYKMPHAIYPINKIPRTRNGKIKRSQLKKEYANNID